jgi:hypothetical protein
MTLEFLSAVKIRFQLQKLLKEILELDKNTIKSIYNKKRGKNNIQMIKKKKVLNHIKK